MNRSESMYVRETKHALTGIQVCIMLKCKVKRKAEQRAEQKAKQKKEAEIAARMREYGMSEDEIQKIIGS